ncbi:MAG: hypothetical protein AAFU59_00280 [Pseudomonadota bacterium]
MPEPRDSIQTSEDGSTKPMVNPAPTPRAMSLEAQLKAARERREQVLAARSIEIPEPPEDLQDLSLSFSAAPEEADAAPDVMVIATEDFEPRLKEDHEGLRRGLPMVGLASGAMSMLLAAAICTLWLMTLANDAPGNGANLAVPAEAAETFSAARPVADRISIDEPDIDLSGPAFAFPSQGPVPSLYRGDGTPELGAESQPRRMLFAEPSLLHMPDDELFDIMVFIPETELASVVIEDTPIALAQSRARSLNRAEPVVMAMAGTVADGLVDSRWHTRPVTGEVADGSSRAVWTSEASADDLQPLNPAPSASTRLAPLTLSVFN